MMPTMAAFTGQAPGGLANDVVARAFAEHSGTDAAVAVQTPVRPLSEGLGHFRILRTSPLTAVPAVCCVDC